MDKLQIFIKILSTLIFFFIVYLAISKTKVASHKNYIIITTVLVVIVCLVLCMDQIKKFYKIENFSSPWVCDKSPNNSFTPLQINDTGDVQCMTVNSDGRNCRWYSSAIECENAAIKFSGDNPLICGDMHKRLYGASGYGNSNHWCTVGRENLEGKEIFEKEVFKMNTPVTQNSPYKEYPNFPIALNKKWKMKINFRLNSGSSNKWQSIIGNMYNNNVSGNRGWGIWVSPWKRLHWSWATNTVNLDTIGEIVEGVDYQLVVEFRNNTLIFSLIGTAFRPFFARGTYGNIDLGKTATDNLFKTSLFNTDRKYVVRRLCDGYCAENYRTMYYERITSPDNFSIYDNMVNTWASPNNRLNINFRLYKNNYDFVNQLNPFNFCNYDDNTIGFPRDCGYMGFQWTSKSNNSTRPNYSYEIAILTTRIELVNNGGNYINNNGFVTIGGRWANYRSGEDFEGTISLVAVYDISYQDVISNLEPYPRPIFNGESYSCPNGWWYSSGENKCYPTCKTNVQQRDNDGYCVCSSNADCPDYGFRCMRGSCKRSAEEANKREVPCQ